MKRIFAILSLCFFTFSLNAQGINFETGTWKDALTKAQKENKLIFVDMYAVWCGPCKMMAKNIFPTPQAGEKYNTLFINCKIDAEKGEGIDLAKKYGISAYPTNLYIDPKTEKVVYRSVGSTDLSGFLLRADNAVTEFKDPMSWADYQKKFNSGNYEESFLKRYIQKAARVGEYSDKALDIYLNKHKDNPKDSDYVFLLNNTHTFDNNAVDFLYQHRGIVNIMNAVKGPNYFSIWKQGLPYYTLQKAIKLKDEKLIDLIDECTKKYGFPQEITGKYAYLKTYYQKTGDKKKAEKVGEKLSDYLVNLPQSEYDSVNHTTKLIIAEKIEDQLLLSGVPDSLQAGIIEKTLKEHPEYSYNANITAANALNETAWSVFENKDASTKDLKKAMLWSQKSMNLAKDFPSWALFADTYAHLLFRSGKEKDAIALQEKAVAKAKENDLQNLKELEMSLTKMKAGAL